MKRENTMPNGNNAHDSDNEEGQPMRKKRMIGTAYEDTEE